VVGKIEAVRPGDPQALAQAAEQARPQMTVAYLRELEGAAQAAARQKIKVHIDPARARTALGLEPETTKPAGKPGLAK
jgi:threonine aldolase